MSVSSVSAEASRLPPPMRKADPMPTNRERHEAERPTSRRTETREGRGRFVDVEA